MDYSSCSEVVVVESYRHYWMGRIVVARLEEVVIAGTLVDFVAGTD